MSQSLSDRGCPLLLSMNYATSGHSRKEPLDSQRCRELKISETMKEISLMVYRGDRQITHISLVEDWSLLWSWPGLEIVIITGLSQMAKGLYNF